MTIETPTSILPEGWTQHELNGRPFWYHAASNTIQQEPPPPPPAIELPNETAMYPCPPEPASEPVPQAVQPPLPPAVQVQPGVYLSPQSPRTNTTSPDAQIVQVSLPQSMPVSGASVPLAAQALAQPNAQAQQSEVPIYARRPSQHMVNLQVLVPEPGLRPGQQLAFTAPPSRPGQPQQPMVVTVNQQVLPGSIVTVQYHTPSTIASNPSVTTALGRTPSPPMVEVSTSQDSEYMKYTWLLYAAGCVCMCCFFPFGMLLWVVASSLYFCKPAQERAQFPRTRNPAFVNLITLLVCCCLGMMMIPAAMIAFEESGGKFDFDPDSFRPGHHHGPHHGPPHGPPGVFFRGSRASPQPGKFMKHFFQSWRSQMQESAVPPSTHSEAMDSKSRLFPLSPERPYAAPPAAEDAPKPQAWNNDNWFEKEATEPAKVDKLFFD